MYSYVKALALSRSIGSQWKEVPLAAILVFDIYQTYSKIYLVLNNSVLATEVVVDMDVLRAQYSSYAGTLEALLVTIGNATLPTVPSLPNTEVKFAKYSDAVRVGYKVKTCIMGREVPDNYPANELIDLKMDRPNYQTDMDLIEDYCLVSVNGHYHWNESAGNHAYIKDGGKTLQHSKLNHLGILSFLDIGKLTKIHLDPEEIVPVTAGTELRDKINFSVTEDLDNKSYILILGGYMILPQEGVFWRSGQHGFTLDINRITYMERLLESHKYMDMKALGLTTYPLGDNVFNTAEIMSDTVIRKYMTLSQSFLVLVDVPHLVSNKINIRHSNLPGMFTSYQDPVYPLIVNYGKVAEYWKTEEDGFWSVNVQDSYLRNYVASQQPVKSEQAINDAMLANKPFYHSRGFLLELAGFGWNEQY